MRRCVWNCVALGGLTCLLSAGCVSLAQHDRLRASLRTTSAEKEALAQELYDARQVTDSLRSRLDSVEGTLSATDELVKNLREENDLLEHVRRKAEGEVERMASHMNLSDIVITGPKLPAQLDSALKRFADAHPSAVTYDAAAGTLKWSADLLFALGSDVVKNSSKEALRQFAEIVKSPAAADFEVLVVGHTDARPIVKSATKQKHPTNWHLSAHRAIAVGEVLQQSGYTPARIGVMGYGQYRPTADNATADGAEQNRRVEIYLIPAGSIVKSADAAVIGGSRVALLPAPE